MKTFKMYVKTVIYNEQNNILLLKKKCDDDTAIWDLPGAPFTEEQSFDETVINNVQKEIGYYVYPGKIIGISDYSHKEGKEVNVIMEGNILNGDLLLSKDYETHIWIPIDRIKEYPLTPWLKDYIKNNKNPFEDVETEIEEITNKRQRRRESIREDINNIHSGNNSERINEGVKSSFGLLKDTIIRTFHPQEAKITKTTPKSKESNDKNSIKEKEENNGILSKFNMNFKKGKKEEEEYLSEALLKDNENDIIIEHDEEDLIEETDSEIPVNQKDIVEENVTKNAETQKTPSENKKVFDMNVNRQKNLNSTTEKTERPVQESKRIQKSNKVNTSSNEPEIKIIHKNEKTPLIRKVKESKEKVSFNSENIKRYGWKERLNKINRTEANDRKKEVPRPKGQRK